MHFSKSIRYMLVILLKLVTYELDLSAVQVV